LEVSDADRVFLPEILSRSKQRFCPRCPIFKNEHRETYSRYLKNSQLIEQSLLAIQQMLKGTRATLKFTAIVFRS